MVIWLDGPYGVGKSTLAGELRRLEPTVHIFDAEEVGNAVRGNMPPELFNGYIYEGYPLWFSFCAELLAEIAANRPGHICVPMTLTEPDSFDRIAAPLAKRGIDSLHILLEAGRDTVRERILSRGEEEGCWCMENIGLCLRRQRDFTGVLRIDTEGRTPAALARQVLESVRDL